MFRQNARIPLRFGEQAERILPGWTAATSLDLCWDKEWECLLALDWADDHLTVTAHRFKDKKPVVHPFPKDMLNFSRLFRYQDSICLLTGDRGRQSRIKALLRIPRLGATVVEQEVPTRMDMNVKIAPEMTKKRREVLMELRKNVPITVINATGYYPADIEEQIPRYPVVVGYPSESDIRFSPTGRSIAIGSLNHLVAAWLVEGSWQTHNFAKEIREKINRGRAKYLFLQSYNAFANDRYATFGIEANFGIEHVEDTKTEFYTLVVKLNGNQAQVDSLFPTMYAPPIRTVE